MRNLAQIAILVVLVGCHIAPDPGGAHREGPRYRVLTDTSDVAFASSVLQCAEHTHEQLASYFRHDVSREPFSMVVFTSHDSARRVFDDEFGPGRADTIGGFCNAADRYAVIDWSCDTALVHELVHRFVAETVPRIVLSWKDEGLACALAVIDPLAHGGHFDDGEIYCLDAYHPVWAHHMTEADLRARCAFLGECPVCRDVDDLRVAAALARYGLETKGWQSVSEIDAWRPDIPGFVAWLRDIKPNTRFRRFSPIQCPWFHPATATPLPPR
jgi:hypothetical protein